MREAPLSMCATSAPSRNLHSLQLQTPHPETKRQIRMCQASVGTTESDERMILEYLATVVRKEALSGNSATSKGYTAPRPRWDGNPHGSFQLVLMPRIRQLATVNRSSLFGIRGTPQSAGTSS